MLQHVYRGIDVLESSDRNDRNIGKVLLHMGYQIYSAQTRQFDVSDHKIDIAFGKLRQRVFSG